MEFSLPALRKNSNRVPAPAHDKDPDLRSLPLPVHKSKAESRKTDPLLQDISFSFDILRLKTSSDPHNIPVAVP